MVFGLMFSRRRPVDEGEPEDRNNAPYQPVGDRSYARCDNVNDVRAAGAVQPWRMPAIVTDGAVMAAAPATT